MERLGYRHEALIYADSEEFLDASMAFLYTGIELGEPTAIAVGRANTELLEGELGVDAEMVRFVDMEELGRNPARIIPFWRDFLDEHPGSTVRGIGEPVWPGRSAAELEECRQHESLIELSLAPASGLSLLCPYDASALEDRVLESVARSHVLIFRGGERSLSETYEPVADLLDLKLSPHPPGAAAFEFDDADLAEVRRRVRESAEAADVSRSTIPDLVLAASELAANSVAHGGGVGTLRLWTEDSVLVVEFHDEGRLMDPMAGRVRPSLTQEGGRGLWLANQLCDLVQIRSDDDGATVRLHARRA